MTGSYELCMLIDGVIKRYPTAVVDLETPYFRQKTKVHVLCMETPVQDIVIGNVPGACGTDAGCYKEQGMKCEKQTSTNEIYAKTSITEIRL